MSHIMIIIGLNAKSPPTMSVNTRCGLARCAIQKGEEYFTALLKTCLFFRHFDDAPQPFHARRSLLQTSLVSLIQH